MWMIVREEGEGTPVSPHTSALILASSSSLSSRASRVGPSPGGLILRISQLSHSKVAVRCGASNSFKMNFLYLLRLSQIHILQDKIHQVINSIHDINKRQTNKLFKTHRNKGNPNTSHTLDPSNERECLLGLNHPDPDSHQQHDRKIISAFLLFLTYPRFFHLQTTQLFFEL